MSNPPLIVGLSGASGAIYGIRLLELLDERKVAVHLVISQAAEHTVRLETDYKLAQVKALATVCYDAGDQTAAMASGSFKTRGMVIAPCSMKTLAGIASGYAENLMLRAADVTIKERRPLILVCRETPLSPIHLRNMLALAEMGVTIFPPIPSFYSRPRTLEEVMDQFLGRVLETLGIENALYKPWGGASDE